MDITLLINYFIHSNKIRNDEFLFCLRKNIENPLITKIIIFVDDIDKYQFISNLSNKCQLVKSKERMNYSDFFKYSNENLKGIVIVSNLDIYFDDTLRACGNIDFSKIVLALSRTDLISSCSQDSWIFKTPLKLQNMECDFSLGNGGCDNRIAYLLDENKFTIYNPSLTLQTFHLHLTGVRNYIDGLNYYSVAPPYKILIPCHIK